MSSSLRLARSATLAAGVISILVAAPAGAQQRGARMGVAAPPPPQSSIPRIPASPPIATVPTGVVDSRIGVGNRRLVNPHFRNNGLVNQRFQRRFRGNQIVYVPIGGYGCCDGYYGGYPSVYDANGVPLSASFGPNEELPPPSATYNGYSSGAGYTPDLTGSPYVITNEGMMAVDFTSGERRAFPSCAAQGDLRDPKGRPRTIFYHQTDYWMILRPGQQGRVQGDPPAANAKACYAIDAMGNVVLRQ